FALVLQAPVNRFQSHNPAGRLLLRKPQKWPRASRTKSDPKRMSRPVRPNSRQFVHLPDQEQARLPLDSSIYMDALKRIRQIQDNLHAAVRKDRLRCGRTLSRAPQCPKTFDVGSERPAWRVFSVLHNSIHRDYPNNVKVGFHAPLPPARTGVADYAASLLGALRTFGTVELAPARANVRLYHVANNVLHREIYSRAIAEPGVVVLHDALLQHMFMRTLDEDRYIDEFVYNYGEWSRELARELWRGKASSGLLPVCYRYPMLKRLVERSLAVIVHNPAAARIVREQAPYAPVIEIPHLYTCPHLPSVSESLRLRRQLCSAAFLF